MEILLVLVGIVIGFLIGMTLNAHSTLGSSDIKEITFPALLINQKNDYNQRHEKSLNKLFKFTLDRIN